MRLLPSDSLHSLLPLGSGRPLAHYGFILGVSIGPTHPWLALEIPSVCSARCLAFAAGWASGICAVERHDSNVAFTQTGPMHEACSQVQEQDYAYTPTPRLLTPNTAR